MKRGLTLALLAALTIGIAIPVTHTVTANTDEDVIPLKAAKLIIEHNATDNDTGFQSFFDSEGWQNVDVRAPSGHILSFRASGALGQLGLTEIFFETVEPANADVPIEEVLATLPAGEYYISGRLMEAGESPGRTFGSVVLTHDIPAGPELLTPADGATVPTSGVVMSWAPVSETITGEDVTIIAYQLIVEEDAEPPANMIGKFGFSMYVSPRVTSITLPDGFLKAGTAYSWEVLAIEESGNQTLSSGEFETD